MMDPARVYERIEAQEQAKVYRTPEAKAVRAAKNLNESFKEAQLKVETKYYVDKAVESLTRIAVEQARSWQGGAANAGLTAIRKLQEELKTIQTKEAA